MKFLNNFFSKHILQFLARKKWRAKNKNNFTFLDCEAPLYCLDEFFDKIDVGSYSYGPINAIYSNHPNEKLQIGQFCSIGSGTKFILGSEHPYKSLTTYPFKVKIRGDLNEANTKGPIVIEDDVWIGEDCLILSGITIGQGSIIGARSLVVSNIEPYGIYGGSPAKLIKYRFSHDVIKKLEENIDFKKLVNSKNFDFDLLYKEINSENIDNILMSLKNVR